MYSRRQLTLPTIATPSLLAVSSDNEMTQTQKDAESDRFWGGSPSPRLPCKSLDSLGSVKVISPSPPASNRMHPGFNTRDFIGSPSPRPSSPMTVSRTTSNGSGILPSTEIAPPTPTSRSQQSEPGSPTPTPSLIPRSSSRIPKITN
ncbi:hypothetical protein GCK32_017028, partial [Trichostrongylus colubriformis]